MMSASLTDSYPQSSLKLCKQGHIYMIFMYNVNNYLVKFCRNLSGHWFANEILEPFARSSWRQEILEVSRPVYRVSYRTLRLNS